MKVLMVNGGSSEWITLYTYHIKKNLLKRKVKVILASERLEALCHLNSAAEIKEYLYEKFMENRKKTLKIRILRKLK